MRLEKIFIKGRGKTIKDKNGNTVKIAVFDKFEKKWIKQ